MEQFSHCSCCAGPSVCVSALQLLFQPISCCFSSSAAVSAHQLLFQLVSCCFNPSAIVSARQLQPFWWLDMRHLQLIKRLRLFTPTDCCGKSLRHVTDCCGKSLLHVTDCCGKSLRRLTVCYGSESLCDVIDLPGKLPCLLCLCVCLSTVPALFVRVPVHGACSVSALFVLS